MTTRKRATKRPRTAQDDLESSERPDFEALPEADRAKAYQAWYYQQNRGTRAQYKAEKYRNDPSYKERAIKRATKHYWFRERPSKKKKWVAGIPIEQLPVLVQAVLPVTHPEDRRCGQRVEMPMYNLRALGALLNRKPYTLLEWERAGLLPVPAWTARSAHLTLRGRNPRIYTRDEMDTIATASVLLNLPYEHLGDSLFAKALAEGVTQLHQGIRIIR